MLHAAVSNGPGCLSRGPHAQRTCPLPTCHSQAVLALPATLHAWPHGFLLRPGARPRGPRSPTALSCCPPAARPSHGGGSDAPSSGECFLRAPQLSLRPAPRVRLQDPECALRPRVRAGPWSRVHRSHLRLLPWRTREPRRLRGAGRPAHSDANLQPVPRWGVPAVPRLSPRHGHPLPGRARAPRLSCSCHLATRLGHRLPASGGPSPR